MRKPRRAARPTPPPRPETPAAGSDLAHWLGTDAFEAALAAEIDRRKAVDAVANREAVRGRCRTLAGFIREAWPILEPTTPYTHGWHIDFLCDHLEAVTRGEITRLLINIPPGTAKSLIVSVFYPAWEWGPGGHPSKRYLTTSYEEGLAQRDALKMRRLVESEWYRTLWGDTVKLARDQNAKKKFENTKTGGREIRAFGSLTGGRGDTVIVDDPNSTKTAESDLQRAEAQSITRESLPTRVNDQNKSAIIVIQQRLHAQDVTGTLLAMPELGFIHVVLPMEFEEERACRTKWGADPRTVDGELLFPARFDAAAVAKLKVALGAYGTAGQLQQRPAPREGGLFKRAWMEVVRAMPRPAKTVRAWDLAASKPKKKGNDPDWTAGVRCSKGEDGLFYFTGLEHVRETPGSVKRLVKTTASQDGLGTIVRMTQDPGQAGVDQKDSYAKELAGYAFVIKPASGDKEIRATPLSSAFENGLIRIVDAVAPDAPQSEWVRKFIEELCGFPTAAHDDIVDAAADAFNECAGIIPGEGLMEFYRLQAAQAKAEATGERLPAFDGLVCLIPPPGCQTAYGLQGDVYRVNGKGEMWVHPDDAPPLRAIPGWSQAAAADLGVPA